MNAPPPTGGSEQVPAGGQPAAPDPRHPPAPAYAPPPAARSRAARSNWALRLVAGVLSALAFLGFWQLAAHTPRSSGNGYAPPAGTSGGLVQPGSFGGPPNGSTRIS
ncbi:MAG: hypothetical protein IVW57_14865 [Ktedonobacterales bacterium]|nr:hypothetical protein [Ktedonobacterales bacterium]